MTREFVCVSGRRALIGVRQAKAMAVMALTAVTAVVVVWCVCVVCLWEGEAGAWRVAVTAVAVATVAAILNSPARL